MMEDPPPGMGILPVTWASDGKLICNGGLSCAKDYGDGMYMEKRHVFIFICVNCVNIYDGWTDGRTDGWMDGIYLILVENCLGRAPYDSLAFLTGGER